jgi:hypothetical protein
MKAKQTLLALPLFLAVGTGAFAQIITGNPTADAGWNFNYLSTDTGHIMLNAGNSATYSANIYTTAFSLASGSSLLGTLGVSSGWHTGDTIIGVGGVFTPLNNSSLTYSGSTGNANLHLVIKYGAPTATWNAPGVGFAANGAGSLTNGGAGAILLASQSGTIGPTTGITAPINAPTLFDGTGQSTVNGLAVSGQVLTSWSGSSLNGFETFLDLNVLQSLGVGANVALGDDFVVDFQQGTGAFQDSLGVLPSSIASVPEPTMLVTGTLLLAPFASRLMRRKQK